MKRLMILLLCLVSVVCCVFAQIMEPVRWTHDINRDGDHIQISLNASIKQGWHLYGTQLPDGGPQPTRLTLTSEGEPIEVVHLEADPMPKYVYDNMFEMELSYFEKKVMLTAVIPIEQLTGKLVKGELEWIACDNQNCVPGFLSFDIENDNSIVNQSESSLQALFEPVDINVGNAEQISQEREQETEQKGLLWIFILGLLGGLLAIFTPCVWPIIPMTVSFFIKRSANGKAVKDAILYGLSIIIIYVALGLLVTLIFGASALNDISTNAVVNIFFFALLVVFALSFFGAFEITLPASWSTRLDSRARTVSGVVSILLMAFTLVIVSFSCTGPIIGTLLVEAAGRSFAAPALGMLGFAVALALPFSLFAMFPKWMQRMPRSGGWMDSFKVVLAFLELALSLKFFSVADLAYGWHLLDREVFIALWIVIFALLGIYLLGMFRFRHEEKPEGISVFRFMLAVVSLSFSVYMLPGLWGAPLKAISAFAPPMYTQDWVMSGNGTQTQLTKPDKTISIEEALKQAQREDKTLLLDFSGYGCVNCRKMEAKVLSDERVKDALQQFVLLTLMVDDKTRLAEPLTITENGRQRTLKTVGDKNSYLQRTLYGANAQPYYVKLSADGKQNGMAYSYDEDIDKFLHWLQQ